MSPGTVGRVETDGHADTTCAGCNCVVLEFTNHVIDVFPFCDKLGPMKSVPIASVATLATDAHGEEVIFVIHESLWFGHQMEHTLLSSNQVRANDVDLWDNPCDQYHDLAIYNQSSDHPVPLHLDGIVSFTETRAPTDEEIRTLPHVELTSSVEWKPSKATYNLHSLGEGYVGKKRKVSFADTVKGASSKDAAFLLKVSSIWILICGVLLFWASILFQVFPFPFQLLVFPCLAARFPTSLPSYLRPSPIVLLPSTHLQLISKLILHRF